MKTVAIDKTETDIQADNPPDYLVVDEEPIVEITCTKCETTKSWGGGSWCPLCGYYPPGNKFINLEVVGEEASAHQDDLPENFWQAIPRWGWVLFAGVMAIAGISLVVSLTGEAGSSFRSWWAVIQAGLGAILFLAVHSRVFFLATMHSERLNPLSWLVEPIQIWKPIFKEPLQYQWYFRLAVWGQTAVLFALLLIGGLNYSGLFEEDWGIRGVANSSLVNAVEDAEKDKDAEKKTAKVEKASNRIKGGIAKKTKSRHTADCVVIGFTRNSNGQFRELLLASTTGSKLRYVGRLKVSDFTAEEQQEVDRLLEQTPQRKQPIVKTVYNGTWLKPQVMLKVGYDKLTTTSRFKKIQFQSLLKEEK